MTEVQGSAGGGTGAGDDLTLTIGVSLTNLVSGLQTALGDMQGFAVALGAVPMPDVFAPIVTDIDVGEQWIKAEGVPAFGQAMSQMAATVPAAFAGVTEAIVNPVRAAIAEINGLIGSLGHSGGSSGSGVNLSGGLPGFAEGGYTGSGPSGGVAGIVHKGEYVVPQNGALILRDDGSSAARATTVNINGPITVQGVQDPAAMLDALLKEAQRRNKPLNQ